MAKPSDRSPERKLQVVLPVLRRELCAGSCPRQRPPGVWGWPSRRCTTGGSRSWSGCHGAPITPVWRVCVPARRPRGRSPRRWWTASNPMWPSTPRSGRRGAIAR